MKIQDILHQFGVQTTNPGGFCGSIVSTELSSSEIISSSPVDGKIIASVKPLTEKGYHEIIEKSAKAFTEWRMVPAPKRGEVVRQLAEQLRVHKDALGTLVSYEMGKSLQEGLGEVQEMIDICDFAVGFTIS